MWCENMSNKSGYHLLGRKHFVVLFLLFFVIISIGYAGASSQHKRLLSRQHQQFLDSVYKETKTVFTRINQQRAKIKQLHSRYIKTKQLSKKDVVWLQKIANDYKVGQFNEKGSSDWTQLLKRVDVVPYSLVLAQAADESGWGTSRFAKVGHSYFGQRCYVAHCGLLAKHNHFVTKRFSSQQASIAGYLWNLNTYSAYNAFRELRAQMRSQSKVLDSLQLIKKLTYYSQRGSAYVHEISNVLEVFQLKKKYDG